jgi:hypothetical protein
VQVLKKLRPQTGWLLVANAALSSELMERSAAALSMLASHEEGKQVLKDIGCSSLVRATKEEYVALVKYLDH